MSGFLLSRGVALVACSAVVSLLLAGCGGGSSGSAQVSGTVKFNGEPIEDGSISFYPSSGSAGISASIEKGKYAVKGTNPPKAGTYKVVVTWNKKTGKQIPTPGDEAVMMDDVQQVIPPKFSDKDATTLTADLKGTGGETKDFDLKP